MQPAASLPKISRYALSGVARRRIAISLTLAFHAAAGSVMLWSEVGVWGQAAFLLTWALFNCFWLMLLRRPVLSAALSFLMIALIVLLSRFKHDALFMTADFVDLMILDEDTIGFLLMIFPGLRLSVALGLVLGIAAFVAFWWIDHHRVRPRTSAVGGAACLAALLGLSLAMPYDIDDKWMPENYVSKFVRSASVAISDYMTRGVLESDAVVTERLKLTADETCKPPKRAPHIVMILDESSFDVRLVPGAKVPPGYGCHFRSLDGRQRTFLAEGAGGPTWFTEYNVLTGLSSRSYGRFADSLTRFAAGRVERGLPQALARCGYNTFSLYPWRGNFLGARAFQQTAGIQKFLDADFLKSVDNETDSFYFDAARRLIASERSNGPMFVFVYTMANHFPWSYRYRPELAPEWRDLGNAGELDEYLRRQSLSEQDYQEFRAHLAKEFKGEPFLIVRFGDHQPIFAKYMIEPSLEPAALAKRIADLDPRYFTTYYAIDALNFRPASLSSAIDRLDAPYLPLVVLEAAGIPLDATFAEQKRIFRRCNGLFYQCADGAEVRRFNRLLIDAGVIKNL
ncbi:MAG: sulfatase-like hydrolase/transferase [Bradyrhizobiaceae bacterium]|nr:sulfatase-like hydrolase/transferase [Bradyrhizobiaceae bacterium]